MGRLGWGTKGVSGIVLVTVGDCSVSALVAVIVSDPAWSAGRLALVTVLSGKTSIIDTISTSAIAQDLWLNFSPKRERASMFCRLSSDWLDSLRSTHLSSLGALAQSLPGR